MRHGKDYLSDKPAFTTLGQLAEARRVFVEFDASVFGRRFALEDVPEEFVAHFDIDHREEFGHGGIKARHDDVEVVHLPGVRNYGDLIGLGEGRDFASLSDAAHAIGVELDVIERLRLDELPKSIKCVLVLARRDRRTTEAAQLVISVHVVGNDRLLEPAQIERLQQPHHALGVVEAPTHVSVGHDVDAGAILHRDVGREAARSTACPRPARPGPRG